MLIAIILSLGAINALIPLLIVLILIVAAAGSTRGYSIFNFFGLATLAGINPGGKASMVGKSGLSQLMAMVPGFGAGSALKIGSKMHERFKSWRTYRKTSKGLFKKDSVPSIRSSAPQASTGVTQARSGRLKLGLHLRPVYKYKSYKTPEKSEVWKRHTVGSYLRFMFKIPQKDVRPPLRDVLFKKDIYGRPYSSYEKAGRLLGGRWLKYPLIAAMPILLPFYNTINKRINERGRIEALARTPEVQELLKHGEELREKVARGELSEAHALKDFRREYVRTAGSTRVPTHSPERFLAELPIGLASAMLYAKNKEEDRRRGLMEQQEARRKEIMEQQLNQNKKEGMAEEDARKKAERDALKKSQDETNRIIRSEKWQKVRELLVVQTATSLGEVLDVHPMYPTATSGHIIPGVLIGSEDTKKRVREHREELLAAKALDEKLRREKQEEREKRRQNQQPPQ